MGLYHNKIQISIIWKSGGDKMNILLVDDEPAVISTVSYIVKNKCNINGSVYTAQSGNEAIKIIKENRIDLVITDVRLVQKEKAPKSISVTLFGIVTDVNPVQ